MYLFYKIVLTQYKPYVKVSNALQVYGNLSKNM